MELRYLVARCNGKRSFFIVLPEEESALQNRLEKTDSHVFVEGSFTEDELTKKRLERWINKVERWVVTAQLVDSEIISGMICQAHVSGTPVGDLDSFMLEIDPTVPANSKQLIHLLATCGVHQDRALKAYTWFKYTIEPCIALIMMIVLLPIMIMVALMVKMTSEGPIFYSQERVGYRGRIFRIFKFRSMNVNAENGKPTWAIASRSDPKLTSIGGLLRASHLDELPQLFNIILGEVSFIGPRPERPEFVKLLTEKIPLFKLRPLLKPGITGWAQVQQGYANSEEDSLRKLELDLFYLIKHCPSLDFKIVLKTIKVICTGGTEKLKRNRNRITRFPHAMQKRVRTC